MEGGHHPVLRWTMNPSSGRKHLTPPLEELEPKRREGGVRHTLVEPKDHDNRRGDRSGGEYVRGGS